MALAGVAHGAPSSADIAFFEKEIRPLLAENCFKCHGGTDKNGKVKVRAGLQLISRKGILQGGDHGPAINEKEPAKSLILEMVSYKDPDHSMPPKSKLPDEKIATLKKWVEMGAPWNPKDANRLVKVEEEEHSTTKINATTKSYWSHKPLKTPQVPKVSDPAWQKNPLDAFVFARLAKNGLRPNGPASKEVLARRAYYNITGLAPTPEQVAEFVNDKSPDAWKNLIEELLESPHYGEKWARHWLDVVRYAESNGFERDSEKAHIWRYRDWVINAYNNDLPYDDFIKQQLAGDELDEVTPESMIATGFHRLMQWDDEPADKIQYPYDVLDDIARTTAEGFLAMTIGCARCHDHKGDPVPQKDYYSFLAFFHGLTNHGKGNATVVDVSKLGNPDERRRIEEEKQKKIADLTARISAIEKMAVERIAKKDPKIAAQISNTPVRLADPILVADHRSRMQKWHYTTDKPADDWSAVGFRAENAKWKEGVAPFGTQVPNEKAKTKWDTKDIWLQTTFQLTTVPTDLKMTCYHDENIEVFLNGQHIASRGGHVAKYVDIPLKNEAAAALQTGRNVVSVHVRQTGGGQFFDMKLEAAEKKKGKLDFAKLTRQRGREVFTDEQMRTYKKFIADLKKIRTQPSAGAVHAMVVKEHGTKAGQMHVHIRGNANSKGEPVGLSFPQILGGGKEVKIPEPKDGQKSTGRRRVLAEWIADPHNPRTARVAVNRVWQQHFGNGICPTPSDFGYLGMKPTHPHLLDWLATEFVRRKWSVKELQRMIMNSKTYQMSSRGRADALEKDPQNNLLWRFNMRRLSAEEIRDNILAATGQLNLKMGGPSFFAKLDQVVLDTSSTKGGKWGNSPVEEQNRRAVYGKVKRSLKDPMMTGFDFGDTDAPCPVRFVTTVPTQALNMLNSTFLNEQAVLFSKRLGEEVGGDLTARIKRGLALATGHEPSSEQLAMGQKFIDEMKNKHQITEEVAFERFCLLVLNLNEFVYID